MDVFTMVVLIVLITVVADLYGKTLKYRRNVDKRLNTLDEANSGDRNVQQELRALRERVAALEAIVTEPRYELNRKLEELERV